ncbi:MAG: Cytoplasmic protein [Nitrospira sp.]|nr:MAG: Cytoplasmic protein [Nitrospira sp.]
MQARSNKPSPPGWPPRAARPRATPSPSQGLRQTDQYDSFNASLLYCGHCRQATPTRQRLLLVLPTGNLYEYLCAQCGTSTGSKTESASGEGGLLAP